MIARIGIVSFCIALQAVDAAANQADVDGAWWQAVTAQIAREEYSTTAGAEGLQAPNRAHNLRTHFRGGGIEITPRASEAVQSWRFAWETAWFGRPGALLAVSNASPEPNGSRVTYRRPGFDEWYDNSPAGLEQGFTIHERPPGTGPLCLAGRLVGPLRAEIASEKDHVDLFDEHGANVLRYGALHVWDAGGIELPSRLALDGRDLAILVEDEGAAYPLTVDPLMTSPSWTVESNQANSMLGFSVATAGDVNGDGFSDVIVGAHAFGNGESNEGRAYVYHGSEVGLTTIPSWTAESNQVGARFGGSVSTAGDVNGDGFSDVIVGAEQFDNVESTEGRAYVYHGSAAGLGTTPAWTAESNQAGAAFGNSVSVAGDVNGDGFSDIIVGAWAFDNGETGEGRAFVFLGSAAGLASQPAWTAESNQTFADFSTWVATAGDVNGDGFSDVIVGADAYDNGQTDEGRAFVYHGSMSGLSANPAWTAESDLAGAALGTSVATAGDVNGDGFSDVIIGADMYAPGGIALGRAYVYHGTAAGLATSAAWTMNGDQAQARFGYPVATAGDVNGDGFADVIVSAHAYNNPESDEGRAFVFLGAAGGLATTAAWTAEGNQQAAGFGFSAATAGDVNGDGFSDVIVSAPSHDNPETNEGRAYVYHGAAAGLASTAAWTGEANQPSAAFGISVAPAGDVNGDGFGDVIVGAHSYDNLESGEGRAYVYHGAAAGLATTAAWTAESNQLSAAFGRSVATAGDVNGDGYADVIVGAYQYENGEDNEGRAYVYHGSATGLAATPGWTAESNQALASFGMSVATAGDVNGDGYSDVIVGARLYDNGETDEGRAYVYHGSATGLAATAAWTAESNRADAWFGHAVATAGDVNGDGFSDIIVGAPQYTNGETREGWVFVYHGSVTGLTTTAVWTQESNQDSAVLGASVATAGDVNGDGYSDVIVGAQDYDNGQNNEGRAFVYDGSENGLAATASWRVESNQAEANFGVSVATAGDVNGDGFSEVIVGAYSFDNGELDEGRAFVYEGSPSGLATTAGWTGESDQASASFGFSVSTAGDVNGDGFAEVMVGAMNYDNGQINEGQSFLYYGNEGPCRRYNLRQLRTDAMTPIVPLGRSDSETQFRINATMLTVYGRTRMQMESEVKPRGVLFDGLNTTPGGFFDTGNDGQVNFGRLVSGLNPATQYHWRVRAKYDLVKTPFQRNGPWVHVPTNGWNETDLSTAGASSGIEVTEAPPYTAHLLQSPRPTPFASSTEIAYTLPAGGRVHLAVYDVMGRERAVLVDAMQTAGRYATSWDGRGERTGTALPAGVYFVRLNFGGDVETQKLVLAP
jgi:FG-GAP repeat/FG-GAP-like repeat